MVGRVQKWCKEHTVVLNIRLNITNDRDIIDALSSKRSKAAYVKGLIRDDIRDR